MRSLLAGTLLFVSIHGDSTTVSTSTSGTTTISSSTGEFDWSQYDMTSYSNDNCASILASTTKAPSSDSSDSSSDSANSANAAAVSSSASSSSSSSSSKASSSGTSSATGGHGYSQSWKKYMNQYASAYTGGGGGSGSGSGTGRGTASSYGGAGAGNGGGAGTSGSSYENQYKNYYGKYYGGTDGPGTYDNNNDGPNGQHKTQVIMCVCTKDNTDPKTGEMDQDGYSKCVNNAYGNNAASWKDTWKKYVDKYKKDKTTDATATDGDSDSVTEAAQAVDAANENAANKDSADSEDSKDSTDGTLGLGTGTNTLEENVQESSLENEKSGLSNGDVDDTRHSKGSSKITHSQYMEYLAIFLIFIGVLSFIAVGVHCVKYTYKSFRLRNYEQIGENSKKVKAQKEKSKLKHKRIRLPRRQKRNSNNNIDDGDEYENEVFTIGEV